MGTVDHWWPVTYDYGLIKADIDSVTAARSQMYSEAGMQITEFQLQEPLADCFGRLAPLSPTPTRELFIGTSNGWTAFVQNGCRGSDPFLPMYQLSRALGTRALRACVTHPQARFPAVILEVYDTPQAGGDPNGYRRSIAAANDGGRWVFTQSGTPYPFEDQESYQRRTKRERFTAKMLDHYIRELGALPLTDGYLARGGRTDAFLIQRQEPKTIIQHSLAKAKALLTT